MQVQLRAGFYTAGYISCCCWFLLADLTHIIMYKLNSGKLRVSGLFFEIPENVSGLKSCFMLAAFAFDQSVNNFEDDTMKVLVNKAKLTGLWARTEQCCYKFNRFWFQNFLDPKSYRAFRKTGRRSVRMVDIFNRRIFIFNTF